MRSRVSRQLLCGAGFPLERRGLGGEQPAILLTFPSLSCHPRVPQDLAALGTAGLAARLGQAVMETLTKVKLSNTVIPGNSFPRGDRHCDHQSWHNVLVFLLQDLELEQPSVHLCLQRKKMSFPDTPSRPRCFVLFAASPRSFAFFFCIFLYFLPVLLVKV